MVRDCQHGFIGGKSCTSNLLEVLDHVGSLLDDGKLQVETIYMDMSQAFDGCLLQKLRAFGFGSSFLQLFSSYLMATSSDLEAASCSGLVLP